MTMNPRIVVAEDDSHIRRLVAITLERQGCVVLEAADGQEALALIQKELPALAILDVKMPEMSGIEVAQALTASGLSARIPVIFLTAHGQTAEVEQGMSAGALAYIVKPFSPKMLVQQVNDILYGQEGVPGT